MGWLSIALCCVHTPRNKKKKLTTFADMSTMTSQHYVKQYLYGSNRKILFPNWRLFKFVGEVNVLIICDPPQHFSHFGDEPRTTGLHDVLSVLKTMICVYSSKTKDTVLTCWFVFFYLPDTKKLCIVDTVA